MGPLTFWFRGTVVAPSVVLPPPFGLGGGLRFVNADVLAAELAVEPLRGGSSGRRLETGGRIIAMSHAVW